MARTGIGWAVDPAGLRLSIERIHREYPPVAIVVTESGAAYPDPVDPETGAVDESGRITYHDAYIAACHEAAAAGVPVHGYFAWTLLDNFEWERGYGPRFGLVRVDRVTLERIPKASAAWYAERIVAAGGGP